MSRLDDDVDVLKSLYHSRGYLQASVIPLVEPGGDGKKVGIVYVCEEGPIARLLSLDIKGNEIISTKDLMGRIKLAPGNPYSPSLVEEGRQALLAAYNDMGFLQAQVVLRVGQPDSNNRFPVVYEIREGTRSIVDRIFVLGNNHTRDSVISKKIKLRTNEPLSLGKLLQTQQSLYGMGVFDQVRVAPQNLLMLADSLRATCAAALVLSVMPGGLAALATERRGVVPGCDQRRLSSVPLPGWLFTDSSMPAADARSCIMVRP